MSALVILERVGIVIYMLAMLGFGTYCLAKPRRLQERFLGMLTPPEGQRGKLRRWWARRSITLVQSEAYLTQLRLLGVVLYVMVAVVVFALYRAAHQ
jgi:hypothetical protein